MDIVIFYEFEERELLNACLLKSEMEKRGYDVEISKVYESRFPFIEKPELIITPFLYHDNDVKTFTSYFFQKVEKILNLQYEQVISKKWLDIGFHCPKGMAQKAVHICWSKSIKKRLKKAGLEDRNLFVTGDLKTDFGRPLFKNFFKSKKELAKEFNIKPNNKWVLFISSFTLPNATDNVIKDLSNKISGDGYEYKKLMVESKKQIMKWVKKFIDKYENVEFIYRPHPNEARFEDPELLELANEKPNFYYISDYSVQQWIVNSDFINTWISTSIIDAYFLGKQCNILRPVKIDENYDSQLLIEAEHTSTYAEFEKFNLLNNTKFPIAKEIIKKYYNISEKPSYELICDLIELMIRDSSYEQDFYTTNSHPQQVLNLFQKFIKETSDKELKRFYESQQKIMKIQRKINKIIGNEIYKDLDNKVEIHITKILTNIKIRNRNELMKCNNKLKNSQKTLKDIKSSKSWKITEPLRKFKSFLKQ